MANSKRQLFLKRRLRVRNKLRRVNAGRLRLSVHRSNKNISAQLIDDVNGVTLASASSMEKTWVLLAKTTSTQRPRLVRQSPSVLKRPVWKEAYFDRGGFLFHGKIKALADAAREGGLKI